MLKTHIWNSLYFILAVYIRGLIYRSDWFLHFIHVNPVFMCYHFWLVQSQSLCASSHCCYCCCCYWLFVVFLFFLSAMPKIVHFRCKYVYIYIYIYRLQHYIESVKALNWSLFKPDLKFAFIFYLLLLYYYCFVYKYYTLSERIE